MHDALPRLDGAFDDASDGSERTGLDRRQLLKLGAWAAPVIVLATAAPAAATSQPPTYGPDYVGNALVLTGIGAHGNQTQTNPYLSVHFDYYYHAGNFNAPDPWGAGSPSSLTTSWVVQVLDSAGNVVATDSGTAVLAKDGALKTFAYNKHLPDKAPALKKGEKYTVSVSVTAMVATNGQGKTCQADPLAAVTAPVPA